jgi:GTP-binding protein
MFKLGNYQFWGSARCKSDWPVDGLAEVAVVGRSNVGKSSLINTLLESRKAARISGNPGKTRALNFYLIDKKFYLVDFPGYGYAKVSKKERENWKTLIEDYLENSKNIKLALLIIDARHSTFKSDLDMNAWFKHYNIPVCLIATKSDKLSRSKLLSLWKKNIKDFRLENNELPIFFSAVTKQGKEEILKNITQRIQ